MNAKTKDLIPNTMQQEAFKGFWMALLTERTAPKLSPTTRDRFMDAGLIEWDGANALKLTPRGYNYGVAKGWMDLWEYKRYTERKAQEAVAAREKARCEAQEDREIAVMGFALGGITDLFNNLATMLYTDAIKAALSYDGDCVFYNVRKGEGSYGRAAEFFYLWKSSNGKSPDYYRDWVTVYRSEDYRGNVTYEINHPSGGGSDLDHVEAHGEAIIAAARFVKLLKMQAATTEVNRA